MPQMFMPKLLEKFQTRTKKQEKTKERPEKLSEKTNGVGVDEPTPVTLS